MAETKNVRVRVTLASKGPGILMNPMSGDLLDELAGVKTKSASDKDTSLDDRAAKKVIRSEKGEIGLPVTYILASLINAGRHVKNGKEKISTATSTTLYEFLQIEDEFLVFADQKTPWSVDKRRGVLNNAGKSVAVAIIRPRFKEWKTTFTIVVDTGVMNTEVVKKIFEAAGAKIGVGDFRPQKKGPFGMFKIDEWEIIG